MNILVLLSVLFGAALADHIEVDWSTVKSIYEIPEWQKTHPSYMKLASTIPHRPRPPHPHPAVKEGRIVGGEQATQHQFPYQVGLVLHFDTGNGWCGGSLVSYNYVMTAAHCVDVISSLLAILGAHNAFLASEPNQQRIFADSSAFKIHNDYDASLIRNDIAVFRLSSPASLNPGIVQSVRLPNFRQADATFAGQMGVVSGWGRFSDASDSLAEILRFVQVPIITNLQCTIRFPGIIQATNICADGGQGRGPCNGDSGGPLSIVEADGITTQVGIVSFGLGLSCEFNWPSAYARVTSFLNWIDDNTDHEIQENWD